MHTFIAGTEDPSTAYHVVFEDENQRRTLFKVPTLSDAMRATCALNGGAAEFYILSETDGTALRVSVGGLS